MNWNSTRCTVAKIPLLSVLFIQVCDRINWINKQPADEYNLRIHFCKHFDSLKFACSLCNKTYTSNRDLNRHLSCHRDEVDIQLPTLSKNFQNSIQSQESPEEVKF